MSIEAMKQVIELYDEHCYNNNYGGIEFNKHYAHKFIESIEALRTAIQQAESEPVAWLDEMLADTKEVFDANGTETPQVVRDVIEYVASWITVYNEKRHPAPGVPDGRVLVPIERSYDQRVKALIAFNRAEKGGKDRDDALQAAWDASLTAAQAQKGSECLPIRGNQVTCSRGTGGCGIQHKGGD